MLNFFLYASIVAFIFTCLILILVVLIQKGRGGGLASAFGGAGGNTAFGSKTGDVLTWVTSVVFGIFLLLAVGLNLLADSANNRMVQPQDTTAQQTAGAVESPATAPATQPK